jgi:predicted PurR-regulated permease PerM
MELSLLPARRERTRAGGGYEAIQRRESMAEQGGMTPRLRTLLVVAGVIIVIFGMRAAADVVNTILLTLLFAIIASPYVEFLIRKGLGRGAAIGVAVLTVVLIGVVLILLIWGALPRLTAKLPVYEDLLGQRMAGLVATLERFGIDSSALTSSDVLSPSRLASLAKGLLGFATQSILQGILLLLLTVFLMLDLELYRARGSGASVIAEYVVNAHDVRRYLSITGLTGLLAAIGNTALLLALGVDFPVLWGVFSFFSNFIPNIGFYLAVIPPLLLALLEFGGLRALLVLVGYFVINMVTDSIIKPRFLKKGIGITPFETLVSLVFWSWVLGPVGAILSVPLTMIVKIAIEPPSADPSPVASEVS